MTEASSSTPKRSRLRIIGWVVGILLLLLIVLYFVLTSSAFFKGFIVPKVGQALNAEVSVASASISPFSQVLLTDLKVRTTGPDPLLTAQKVSLRYKLFDLLRGKLNVDEILLESPVLNLVQNPDGTCNLDPILQASKEEAAPSPKPSEPGQPAQVNLKTAALKNGTVRMIQNFAGDGRNLTEVSALNVTVTGIQNGQTGKIDLGALIRIDNHPPAPGTNGLLEAKLGGSLSLTLSPALAPSALLGQVQLAVQKAEGAMKDLASLTAELSCEVAPKEVKLVALRFKRGDTDLGQVRLHGPFDMAALEGSLQLSILAIDRHVLNLAGAASGSDFGKTTVNSTNLLTLAQGGGRLTAQGEVKIDQFSLTQQGQTTPTLDLRLQYNTTVDQSNQVAHLQTFSLNGTQNGQRILLGELSQPMDLPWGANAQAVGDSTLRFVLTNFHLADWKSFAGNLVSAGDVQATLNLGVKEAGKTLSLDLVSQVTGLSAAVGSDQVSQLNAGLNFRGQIADFNKEKQNLTGKLALNQVSGMYDAYRFADLGATTDLDLAMEKKILTLTQAQLNLTPTDRAKNELQLTGRLDLSDTNATQGNLKLAADSLDFTRYYDLFAAPAQQPPAKPAADTNGDKKTTEPPPETEPAPVVLPLRDFTLEVAIGRLYLRELVVSNWQSTVKIDRSRVLVKPCQLTLNGAPISLAADLNLGVPGYQYDVQIDTGAIPLEPIVNTFTPEDRGKYKGDLGARGDVKGVGVTGMNLRKNLQGQFGLNFSNAVIQIVHPKYNKFFAPIATLLGIPEVVQSPLHDMAIKTDMGSGKINLQTLHLGTPAFLADTSGQIQLKDVLANSSLDNWPMRFALRRPLAERIKAVPSDTPTNAVYVQMPDFIGVSGTLNDPKAKLDAKSLTLSGLEKFADKIPGVDAKTGQLIKDATGFLRGKPASTNQVQQTTNQTQQATNPPAPKFNPLDLLKKLPK